jgi:hypothetical protein
MGGLADAKAFLPARITLQWGSFGGGIMQFVHTAALAALAAAGLATAAEARRVTVDESLLFELGGCALDFDLRVIALCKPVDLGFSIGVTTYIDEEFGNSVDTYSSVVLYDDGLISFGDEIDFVFFPITIQSFDRPVVAVDFDLQDFQPLGQFVSGPSEVVRGPGTFEAFWYKANIFWTCTWYDEVDPEICIDGFFTVNKRPPHARLLIESLPDNGARFTLRWTGGGTNFGYALGVDERALGGNGERIFRFVIGGAQPIPEPATWAMMIAGFGLVGAAARRQRRLSAA